MWFKVGCAQTRAELAVKRFAETIQYGCQPQALLLETYCLLKQYSSEIIMEEEDDDFYAPNDDTPGVALSDTNAIAPNPPPAVKQEKNGDQLEEGEEEGEEVEEDESDSVSMGQPTIGYRTFDDSIRRTLTLSRNEKMDRSPSHLRNPQDISP